MPARRTRPRADPSQIGRLVRALRQARGLQQADLARLTDLDQSTICRLEEGRQSPHADTAARLARALGVPVSELLGSVVIASPVIPRILLDLINAHPAAAPLTGPEESLVTHLHSLGLADTRQLYQMLVAFRACIAPCAPTSHS